MRIVSVVVLAFCLLVHTSLTEKGQHKDLNSKLIDKRNRCSWDASVVAECGHCAAIIGVRVDFNVYYGCSCAKGSCGPCADNETSIEGERLAVPAHS